MRQFAANHDAVFDADPEPSDRMPVRQAGPPPQESLAQGSSSTDYDLPDSPEAQDA